MNRKGFITTLATTAAGLFAFAAHAQPTYPASRTFVSGLCPVCGTAGGTTVLTSLGSPTALGCRNCGCVFLDRIYGK